MNEENTLARIEAGEKKIADVFSPNYTFSIPSYQRPYAWEREQVLELLSDLEEAMSPASRSGQFYFLGSIVLVKKHDVPDSKVVDGQQRLTTLTILFSVIRDLTEDIQRRTAREKYIKQAADADRGLGEKLRLQLRRRDQSFFQRTIQSDGATCKLPELAALKGSQERIVQNAMIIRDNLIGWDEEKRTKLISFLLQHCFLVVVEVPTDAAARRIFTVLNARGLDLSATDILKADLLERAGEVKEEALSERWEQIEEMLGREAFNDLFAHIRMIHQKEKPRTSLEVGFPEHVNAFRGDPESFLEDVLEPYSDAYALSVDEKSQRSQFDQNTVDLIKSLNRLDNKDWVPPLLLCLRMHRDGTGIDVADFVFKLERLSYFLFVTRADVNARMMRYADVISQLEDNEANGVWESGQSRSMGLELTQSEALEFFDCLDGPIYTKTRVVKPLMLRLDQASTDGSASYDHSIITVEHVCPQKIDPGSQWDQWFEDSDTHKYWLHRLGNLLLLNHRKNPAASNWHFGRKKDVYFKSNDSSSFVITQEARNMNAWTVSEIKERQYKMIERLAQTWKLDKYYEAWRETHEQPAN